ncbi:hypothetical protein ACFL13_00715 [Patescibacteria group bacterium]
MKKIPIAIFPVLLLINLFDLISLRGLFLLLLFANSVFVFGFDFFKRKSAHILLGCVLCIVLFLFMKLDFLANQVAYFGMMTLVFICIDRLRLISEYEI